MTYGWSSLYRTSIFRLPQSLVINKIWWSTVDVINITSYQWFNHVSQPTEPQWLGVRNHFQMFRSTQIQQRFRNRSTRSGGWGSSILTLTHTHDLYSIYCFCLSPQNHPTPSNSRIDDSYNYEMAGTKSRNRNNIFFQVLFYHEQKDKITSNLSLRLLTQYLNSSQITTPSQALTNLHAMARQSPPQSAAPQDTITPSLRNAAKAEVEAFRQALA